MSDIILEFVYLNTIGCEFKKNSVKPLPHRGFSSLICIQKSIGLFRME